MIKKIKQLLRFKYFKIFLIGIIIHGICSLIFSYYAEYPENYFAKLMIRKDYSYVEFIFWCGQLLQDFIWMPFLYKAFEEISLGKHVVRFYIDLTVVDLLYLYFSNPHSFNRNKLEYIGYTFLFFVFHTMIAAFKNKKK